LSVGRLASWSQFAAKSGQSETDGSNPVHHHVVRGVGGALSRTAEHTQVSGGAYRRPRHRRRACRVRPRALSSASTRTVRHHGEICRGSDASRSKRPDGERSIAEPSRARFSSREVEWEARPTAADTRRSDLGKSYCLKGRALFSLTLDPSQATRHAHAANVPRSST
jgi:hypothetical protein